MVCELDVQVRRLQRNPAAGEHYSLPAGISSNGLLYPEANLVLALDTHGRLRDNPVVVFQWIIPQPDTLIA
ncbi:MAG TPA: hypothetical protein EYG03_07310 [Planctomycetes bacterium]|nr:hypothetical protein [Fuerstiella sp.]HIK91774.1 hypothetical protein [Planctomycetota bacterium]